MRKILLTVLIVALIAVVGPPLLAKNPAGNPATTTMASRLKQVGIVDPVLQMTAYTYSVPGDWKTDGTVLPGTGCSNIPTPIFRATSPDGLTGAKLLPRFDWAWSSNPAFSKSVPDCLPFQRVMSAEEILKYMMDLTQVEFVRDDPVPELAELQGKLKQQQDEAANHGMTSMTTSSDMRRAMVKYVDNGHPIEEYMTVTTLCFDKTSPYIRPVVHFFNCSAYLNRLRAPAGHLQAETEMLKAIGKSLVPNQEWNAKWAQVMSQQMSAQTSRIMAARQRSFEEGQAMRQRQHEEFMASMQRGTDMSMNRARQATAARGRAADDWCDYALDQQKRRDPNTGEVTKDSSSHTYTWVDSVSGQRYQTNDPNDNPNGRLQGSWVLQENVR
jgi:hypothetical protein